jgi:5-methylcytosine-specific restriction endonuclease McrA
VEQGRDVDHITSRAKAKVLRWSKAKTEALTNLQYLCRPCHKRKTAEETGKVYREPRPAIGLDGWPIE